MAATKTDPLSGFDALPDSAFVRLPTVCALRACSPATVWRHVRLGLIPAPKSLGPRLTAWKVGDLRESLNKAA